MQENNACEAESWPQPKTSLRFSQKKEWNEVFTSSFTPDLRCTKQYIKRNTPTEQISAQMRLALFFEPNCSELRKKKTQSHTREMSTFTGSSSFMQSVQVATRTSRTEAANRRELSRLQLLSILKDFFLKPSFALFCRLGSQNEVKFIVEVSNCVFNM